MALRLLIELLVILTLLPAPKPVDPCARYGMNRTYVTPYNIDEVNANQDIPFLVFVSNGTFSFISDYDIVIELIVQYAPNGQFVYSLKQRKLVGGEYRLRTDEPFGDRITAIDICWYDSRCSTMEYCIERT